QLDLARCHDIGVRRYKRAIGEGLAREPEHSKRRTRSLDPPRRGSISPPDASVSGDSAAHRINVQLALLTAGVTCFDLPLAALKLDLCDLPISAFFKRPNDLRQGPGVGRRQFVPEPAAEPAGLRHGRTG